MTVRRVQSSRPWGQRLKNPDDRKVALAYRWIVRTRSLGTTNSVLCGVDDAWRGRGIFVVFWRESMCLTSLTPLWIVNWTGPCSGVHMIGADAWLQALDELIIGREKRKKGKIEYLYSANYYACIVSKRSDIDHTGLPANYTMPAFPS